MVHLPWLLSFPRAFVLAPRTSPFVFPGLNLTVVGGLGHRLFRAAFWAPELPAPKGWLDIVSFFARLLVLDAHVFHEVVRICCTVSHSPSVPPLVLSSEGSIRVLTLTGGRMIKKAFHAFWQRPTIPWGDNS